MKRLLLLLLLPSFVFALSLDDDEADDIDDAIEYAYELASDNKFSKAKTVLNQAMQNVDEADELSKALSVVKKKHNAYITEQERLAKLKREKEKQARLAQASSNSANYGLSSNNCYRVSGNYALYQYCTTGSCDGFYNSYAQKNLCKNDDPGGFHSSSRNTNIYLYLKNGGYLSYDHFSNNAAYQSGNFNGSFRERKNFVLYLLNGFVLRK